ncbi:MAG: 1-deoxy-D-xylulose-5-phosphate synthase [Actinomycetota bacterium]
MTIESINQPSDLRRLSYLEIDDLAGEIRDFIVQAVATNSGHLGSNLGAVELTLALHRVFDSPNDAILWDTGHQAYVHKIVTGRSQGFSQLRQANGLSGRKANTITSKIVMLQQSCHMPTECLSLAKQESTSTATSSP